VEQQQQQNDHFSSHHRDQTQTGSEVDQISRCFLNANSRQYFMLSPNKVNYNMAQRDRQKRLLDATAC
jgi:hypothetical protein